MIPGMPAVISTEWSIAAGNFDSFPPRTFELQNPYLTGVMVNELHFSNTNRSTPSFLPFQAYLRLELRGHPITKDYVRGRLLAPRPDGDGDVLIKFARPIYVAPNDVVSIWGRPATATISGIVSLRGTFVAPLARGSKVWMPYFADYEPTPVTNGTAATLTSSPLDLRNPFQSPLYVEHMIGYRDSATLSHATIYNDPPINILVRTHDGLPVMRDLIPFYDLFHTRDRSWNIKSTLEPGGYYIVTAEVDNTGYILPIGFGIGMVGYREVTV